jgi:hypothetical protein
MELIKFLILEIFYNKLGNILMYKELHYGVEVWVHFAQ